VICRIKILDSGFSPLLEIFKIFVDKRGENPYIAIDQGPLRLLPIKRPQDS